MLIRTHHQHISGSYKLKEQKHIRPQTHLQRYPCYIPEREREHCYQVAKPNKFETSMSITLVYMCDMYL